MTDMPVSQLTAIIDKLRVEETRWDAILDLKLLEEPNLAQALAAYIYDNEWVIRWCIAEKFGDMKDPIAIRSLCHLLQDQDYHVRKNAVKALLRFGPEICPRLVEFLASPNLFVRRHIYAILLHFGKLAIPYLAEQVLLAKEWIVLHRIIHTLYAIGGKKSEDALIKALKHPDHQKSIILLLGDMRVERALPAMIKLYKEPKMRRCILAAVAHIGYKTAVPVLIMALSKGTPAVKSSAEMMLLKIGEACLPHLLKAMLQENMPHERLITLVEKIGPEPVLKAVHRLAERNEVFRARTKAFRKAHPLPEGAKKRLGEFMHFLGDIGDALLR